MADQPVSLAVFEAFQHKLFSHLGGIDRRFEALEQAMNSQFVEVRGQIDALAHRLLRLEDEYVAIKEGLGRLEAKGDRLEAKVDRLEVKVDSLSERVSRVETRLDELVAAEPRYALRADVQDLRARVKGLEAQIGLLQKRVDRQ